jgi:hypothetical protein
MLKGAFIQRRLRPQSAQGPVEDQPPAMMTRPMQWFLALVLALSPLARQARAQSDYRNLDAGFPVRIEDAIVTDRYALNLDLANLRFDALSGGRRRLQLEPELSYGIFPRTEMWLRATGYYREREVTPRKGIAGVGLGGMHQFTVETFSAPALALASEIFVPTGPRALPPSYSLKALLTRSSTWGRIHLNASLASYATRVLSSNCLPLPGGSTCSTGGPVASLPPLDGPCEMAPEAVSESPMRTDLQAAPATSNASAQSASSPVVTHAHWLAGIGADKTLPIKSVVFVGDLFVEQFEGIGRGPDWTTELGARKQVTPSVVVVGSLGRHFRGLNDSLFFVIGATFGRALQLFGGAD